MACRTCGAYTSEDVPTPLHCGKCPPWTCHDCGGLDSIEAPCGCWVSLESLSLADQKGLLAKAGLSVDPTGEKNDDS